MSATRSLKVDPLDPELTVYDTPSLIWMFRNTFRMCDIDVLHFRDLKIICYEQTRIPLPSVKRSLTPNAFAQIHRTIYTDFA